MDRQRIEFDEKGIKVYTNNGLIENNGKTTHTTISGVFEMSANSVTNLLTHFTDSTFKARVAPLFFREWCLVTSEEEIKKMVADGIKEVEESYREKLDRATTAMCEYNGKINRLQKLIEDHNRGCVGLFHKKIKL